MQGSYRCEGCDRGYIKSGDQCVPEDRTVCPDGVVCDGNANCVQRLGIRGYVCQCKVRLLRLQLEGWIGVEGK